jgi:hypothetical protein
LALTFPAFAVGFPTGLTYSTPMTAPYTRWPAKTPAGPPQPSLHANTPGCGVRPSTTSGCIHPICGIMISPASTAGPREKTTPCQSGFQSWLDQKK